jgi:bifunctional non-homologous end joining protein LigD
MLLARLAVPFDDPEWVYELKYDGFRAIAAVEGGACSLISRKGNVYKSFGALCEQIPAAIGHDAVLDGEIVHLDAAGRPQFYDLMRRRPPQQFVAFDLLWLDGQDLRQLPLLERKRRLRDLVSDVGPVLYADHVPESGVDLFRAVCEQDLEGIVAKRRDGLYTPEATTWVKIKNPRYSQAEGRRELVERRRAAGV